MLLSIIVPCYNEQDALPLFYREASAVLSQMDCDYELLQINDRSKDSTLAIMKELAAGDPHVFYFSFSRNFGKEAAMYAGFAMRAAITLPSWMQTCRIRPLFCRRW